MKKLYRSKFDKEIAGVCGGLAEYFNIDSAIIRIAFVLLCLMVGSGLILYILCAIIIPENPSDVYLINKNKKRLHKSRENKIIAGVCGGLAEYFNIDPSIVRIIWLISILFFGSGLMLYLVLAFCLAND